MRELRWVSCGESDVVDVRVGVGVYRAQRSGDANGGVWVPGCSGLRAGFLLLEDVRGRSWWWIHSSAAWTHLMGLSGYISP